MIKMRVSDQNQVDWWEIRNSQPWLPQSLQHEQPARKVGVDDDIQPANRHKKACVPDERDAQLSVVNQLGFVRLPGARGDRGMANQSPELRGPFADRWIPKCRLDHGPVFLMCPLRAEASQRRTMKARDEPSITGAPR